MDDGTRNIVTIEDPVEFDIPTFRQLPVDLKHGITMTSGLRILLRLDPDVVLVGEIRDAEAAETAMRAASSGKYVFTSLHTRDVASTVTALRDLHIDNRSLAGNLAGIISQRLVRRLCRECSRAEAPNELDAVIFRELKLPVPVQIRHPVGCTQCHGTGYFDRIGLFELITSDDGIVHAIEAGKSEEELRQLIQDHGTCTLQKDALQKVAEGMISMEDASTMTSLQFTPTSLVTEPSLTH
jgi:type II secretory ATPase GspE/PulE/Tfp pilus assembly ATPase PilB-like protein